MTIYMFGECINTFWFLIDISNKYTFCKSASFIGFLNLFPCHYFVKTLWNFTILILPLPFLHHQILYHSPFFSCLTCFIITLVLQTPPFPRVWFAVSSDRSSCSDDALPAGFVFVVLPILFEGFVKFWDPIISSGIIPAKKIIRTVALLTELKGGYHLIQ